MTLVATCAAVLLLAAAGWLPTIVLVGRRPISLVTAPVTGAVMAGVSGSLAVVLHLWLLPVVAVLAAVVNLSCLVLLRRTAPPASGAPNEGLAVAWSAGAMAFALVALRAPTLGHDARSIWLLHARLFGEPGRYADAMALAPYDFSHMDYPLLVPATVGAVWASIGESTHRVGQLVIALLGACSIAALATSVAAVRPTRTGNLARHLAPAVAAAVALACAGTARGGLSDGLADALVAATAATATLRALVLPLSRSNAGLAAIFLAAAATTKNEGAVAAGIITVLYVGRVLRSRTDSRLAWVTVAGLVPALLWFPIAVALGARLGSSGNFRGSPGYPGAALDRLGHTLDAMWNEIWPWQLVVLLTIILVVATLSRAPGLPWRPSVLACTVVTGYLAFMVFGFVVGDFEIRSWLESTGGRVTTYVRMVALAELGVLAIALLTWEPSRSTRGPAHRRTSTDFDADARHRGPRAT